MPIATVEELRDHIALAIRVELSTIPPYLFAMYSIEDRQSEAALLIRSIVAEEMLHAALCANLLLAVGGEPRFDTTQHMPTYPMLLPHHRPPLELALVPCADDVIRNVFMRIEQPEVHGAPDEPDVFETLGQFYHALEHGIEALAERVDLFADPQAECQLSDPSFYAPVAFDAEDSGGLMLVDDVETALAAIEIIVHQGEGLSTERWADPAHQELTHYHKLLQIVDGTSPLGAVFPVRPGPRTAGYPPTLQPASELFNALYRYVFLMLDELFSPSREKPSTVATLYRLMADSMSTVAYFLVRQDLGDGTHAAPTFEIYEFGEDPWAELHDLADGVNRAYPGLAVSVA
jgi:rubrerythrin